MTATERRQERKAREAAAISKLKWGSKLADRSWPDAEWQAYLKWRRDEGKAEDMSCPPLPGIERGKIWSRQLRRMWPNYGRVVITHYRKGILQWVRENGGYHWNGDGNIWYFKDRDTAALFKLTFGGAQND